MVVVGEYKPQKPPNKKTFVKIPASQSARPGRALQNPIRFVVRNRTARIAVCPEVLYKFRANRWSL
jgi:hypothetical protein